MNDILVTQNGELSPDELREMFGYGAPTPADLREQMRSQLAALPQAARAVYRRDNIADPKTPLLTVVETVLYHFDQRNRRSVAQQLQLTDRELCLLLIGYGLGRERGGPR